MEIATLCLVSFSVRRARGKYTEEQEEILARLKECFSNLNGPVSSIEGQYILNQDFYEAHTCLKTNFSEMDFVDLPLESSLWITEMYLANKLDIIVHYSMNDGQTYQPHTCFPDWDILKTKECEIGRKNLYSKGVSEIYKKLSLS